MQFAKTLVQTGDAPSDIHTTGHHPSSRVGAVVNALALALRHTLWVRVL